MTLRQLLQDFTFNEVVGIKRHSAGLLDNLEKSGHKVWLDYEMICLKGIDDFLSAIDKLSIEDREALWDWIYNHQLVGGMIVESK